MKSEIAVKLWTVLLTMCLLIGCGETTGDGKAKAAPEAVKAAFKLLQKGKVQELRTTLVNDRSIANTPYRKYSLLDWVIDTRPAFPNMHASVKVLLEAGADPNANAPHLLRKAIWRQDPETYELLLKHGADPTIVWTKKNINMLEYSRTKGDKRFDKITDAWEKAQKEAVR